jgi:chromosome segregation ATPase
VIGAIDAEDCPVDQFLDCQGDRTKLFAKIVTFKESHLKMIFQNSQFQTDFKHLQERLNVDHVSRVVPGVDELLSDFRHLTAELEKANLEVRRHKKDIAAVRAQADCELHILSEQLDSLQDAFNCISEKQSEYEKQIQSHEAIKKEHVTEIEQLHEEISALKLEHGSSAPDESVLYPQQVQSLQSQYQTRLSEHQQQLHEAQEQLEKAEQQISVLKRTARLLKVKLKQSEESVRTTKAEADAEIARLKHRFEEEIKNVKDVNEEALNRLKAQSADLRATVAKLTEAVQALETEKQKQLKRNRLLRKQVIHVESQLSIHLDSAAQDRKLAEAQCKAAELNAASKIQSVVATARSEYEKELRKLITMVHEEFRRFVDPHEQIDRVSFQKVVSRARDELMRLQEETAAVRQIINASPGQSTPDALAQFLCNAH